MSRIFKIHAEVDEQAVGSVLSLLEGKVKNVGYEIVEVVDKRNGVKVDVNMVHATLSNKGPMRLKTLAAVFKMKTPAIKYYINILKKSKRVKQAPGFMWKAV